MPKTPIHHFPSVPEGVVPVQHHRSDQPSSRTRSSNLLTTVSIVLAIAIATGAVISGLGRAFFVTKDEYTTYTLKDVKEKTELSSALDRIGQALSRQEAAFNKMSDSVQTIQIEMAKRK
jgi:hypothetical protein